MGTTKGRLGRLGCAVLCSVAAGVAAPGEASAQDRFNTRQGRITNGFFYRATTALRVNPLGLFVEARAGIRHRLFDPGSGPLILRNTYIAIAPSLVASPAFVRPGIAMEFSPLAILNFSALVEYVQFFGSFNLAQTWQNSRADYSNAAVFGTAAGREGGADTANGLQVNLSALLQARAGDIVLRSNFRGIYFNLTFKKPPNGAPDGTPPGPVYYDQFFDVLAPTNGWLFVNDSDLLYQSQELGLTVGLRFSSVMPLYTSRERVGGVGDDSDRTTMRLGPLIAYTLSERRHGPFNAPSIFALAQWWIQHPYRTADIGGAMPNIVIGFSFRGDS
ncbi:MAG: hypothetical protein U0325_26820 [Polyangiales bacterium]